MYEHERKERSEVGRGIARIAKPKPANGLGVQMRRYLESRELSYELAVENGWYATVSNGSQRIVIPCINSAGFNYWQARAMGDNKLRYDSPAIPRKDSIVFLWPGNHANFGGSVIITEGPMDALAAAEFHPAIAIMGGSPSDEVLDFIVAKTNALGLFHWVLIPDNDNLAFTAKFVQRKEGFSVYTPSGKDLAGMPRWERTKLFAQIGRRI